jgi:hypothetical protein
MATGANDVPDDELEQLRRRFEEFRNSQPVRSRLPENLWLAAAELAKRHGVNPIARALHLDYSGLRKRALKQGRPKEKRVGAQAPGFLEFLAPGAKAVTNCTVEVESTQGAKLRLELKAVATPELVSLIRAFVSQ